MNSTDWIAHHADRNPSGIACVDVRSGRTRDYAAFDSRISKLANALRDLFNVPAGGRVLVLSRNDIDVFEIQFACQRAAMIFVPLNWRLAPNELVTIAHDAAPSILFYGSEFRGAAEMIASAASIRHAVEMQGGQRGEYESVIARSAAARRTMERTDQDIWALLYTSGTTGTPKAAQLSYGMMLCNAVVLGSEFRITAECKNLVTLPTFHTGGLNVFANPVFFYGGTNVVVRDFEASLIIDLLTRRQTGITHMMGVPATHAMLAKERDFDGIGLSGLREVSVAGAPCPVPLIERYSECGITLRQCWGMTEVGPHALLMPRNQSAQKYGSSGLPNIFARVVIADRDGRPVQDGKVGELLVDGPVVTPGYWQRAEADRDAFTTTGWFRTGDAAYRDHDGFFYIVDRWKEMYISGGENVYPAEVEKVLSGCVGIEECAVVGIFDEKWGEVGRAFVVRKHEGVDDTLLRQHCEGHLARYKIPKEFKFVDALPRNASGKILKQRLREVP
jgi:fatty-acyl-CoA synthase